jgi:hypothetical protein
MIKEVVEVGLLILLLSLSASLLILLTNREIKRGRDNRKSLLALDKTPNSGTVYVKWDEDSNFIMAFIAEHFKTSNYKLIDELSLHLGRSSSSLKRKISRLRGIKTNKSPFASGVEVGLVRSLDGSNIEDENNVKSLMTSFINIGLSDSQIYCLQDLMIASKTTR